MYSVFNFVGLFCLPHFEFLGFLILFLLEIEMVLKKGLNFCVHIGYSLYIVVVFNLKCDQPALCSIFKSRKQSC